MKRRLLRPLFLALGLSAAWQAQAGHWVAGRDLVTNETAGSTQELTNPNGSVPQWSYGTRGTQTSGTNELNLFVAAEHSNNAATWEGWAKATGFATVGVVTRAPGSPAPSGVIRQGEMIMHPPPSGFTVVRWTAPAAGLYSVTALWQDVDWNGGDGCNASIVKNGTTVVFNFDFDNGNGAFASQTVSLSAGDTLDFLLGIRGNDGADTTRFNATVTTIKTTNDLWVGGRDLAAIEKPDGGANETTNPNPTVPQWSYGRRSTPVASNLTLYSGTGEHLNSAAGGGPDDSIEGWSADAGVGLLVNTDATTPVTYNYGFGPNLPFNPGDMVIGAGYPSGPYPVVRWTAPAAGRYEAFAFWQDVDFHGGDGFSAHIVVNGIEKYVQPISNAHGTSVAYKLDLAAGDQVDFTMGANGDLSFDTTKFNVSIVRPALHLTNAPFPLAGGQVETAGGTGPFTFSVVGGSLPAGLSMSSTGLVTGTPVNGPYSVTVRVTDSLLATDDHVFSGVAELPVPTSKGIVAQWPGDNTVADIIGSNHLSMQNNPTYTEGKVGQAFQFNGTDQSVQTVVSTDVMKHLPLTIEGWIKPEARTSGSISDPLPTNVINNDLQNFGGHGFGAHLYPDGSKLNVGIEGASEDFHTVPGVTFTDNTWVHVAVVYSTGNVKTYLNGVLQDDYSFTQGALNGNTIVRIGRHNDDTGYGSRRFFKGAVDELTLYHRALSAGDVSTVFNAGAGGKARHDAARDYSTTTANGPVWSYRWQLSSMSLDSYDPGEVSSPLLSANGGFDSNGVHSWTGDAFVTLNPGASEVVVNSAGYQYTWLPKQLGMGPNSGDQRAVVRWKAPQAGVYAVSGTFYGADTRPTTVDVHIFHNSTQLSPDGVYPDGKRAVRTYRGDGVSHTQLIEAAKDDTVDFVLGSGINGWTYDSSGLAAFVTRLGDVIPTTGGNIAAWGQGANGALGNGASDSEVSPVPVTMSGALSGKSISAVAGGFGHSLALDTTGKVYAWGNNESGQIGDGSTVNRMTPVAVTTSGALSGKTVKSIAACDGVSFAVTTDGQLITWGRKQVSSFTSSAAYNYTPVRVTDSLLSKTVASVACGVYHVLALTSDGEIHSWGVNHAGQLGTGTTVGRDVAAKMTVTGTALSGKTVTAVAIVGGSSFALTSDGKVFAWGLNDFGQLGDGSVANRSLPVLLGGLLSSKTITAIGSGGTKHQLALASDGTLFAWGDNSTGALGNGSTTASNTPVSVTLTGALAGLTVSNVYVGTDYSLVRTTEGQLFAWGTDTDGQVGDGASTESQQLEPVAVDSATVLGGKFVVAAAAGVSHALAVVSGPVVQEITVRGPTNANITDGGTVSLGNQAVGTPAAPRNFTIRNDGSATLTITSITLSGTNAADFGLNSSGAVGAIAPGSSRTFSITFTAPALGARSTTVNIVSDDGDEGTFDFTLTGSGSTDATPPTLDVIDTWVEKVSSKYAFKLLVDARDNVGVDKVQVRSKTNTTAALPDTTPWTDWTWRRDEPVIVTATGSSIVIELRALDTAGNPSPIQRRVFKSPFPLSTAPNLNPKFVADKVFTGSTIDCRGLFSADFNGDGRDDLLQIDRITGLVKVRQQQSDGTFTSTGFNVATNAVSDSAIGDFDGDGKPDIALVLNNALVVYHNDGPNGSNGLDFSLMNTAGLATTGISAVVGVAVGDVTGEGKDDIVISGTGDDGAMGTVAKIAVLINNSQFQLGASNNAFAFPTSSAGPLRIGDVTGDGWNDVVTIDAANNQVLLFINKRNGSFGGANDPDSAARPQATVTDGLPPQAIAIGDVTGDGRADVIVTLHSFEALDGPGTERDHLLALLLDSRGAAPLHANTPILIGQGDLAASSTPFRSDVILQDLNGDRFPEAIFTNPFEAGTPKGGVRALRFTSLLDNTNTLSSFSTTTFGYATGAPDPHRLASGRFQSTRPDIILASGGSEQVQYVFSTYTELSKTYDLATGASTDIDPDGTTDTNDQLVYDVQIGGLITYSINYVNNGTTAITGGVVECLLPASLSIESGDAGYTTVAAGTSKYIRWTQDIPAGSSGVKRFVVRVVSGIANTGLQPKVNFKRGTTVLVTKTMPKVVLEEPLTLTVTVLSDSDNYGQKVHVDELITYRMKVKNRGTGPVSGFKLGTSIPANTELHSGTSPPTPVLGGKFPAYTSATWTNLTLQAGESVTFDLRVRVKTTAAVGKTIDNATITVTRSDGQKIVAPKASVLVSPPLEITLKANKNIVQPGDTIRYTFTVRNWLGTAVTNAKVVDMLPSGVSLLTMAANDALDSPNGNGNFVYSAGSFAAATLSPTTLPAFDSSTGIMTWVLGTVPAGAQRSIEFDVIVKQDIPTFYNANGVSVTQEVQNKSYNFVASSSTNTRLFAAAAKGGSAANKPNATSDDLLSTALAARRSLLSDPPLDAPKMVLIKTPLGDGETFIGGQKIATVINDPSVTTDGFCDFKLSFANFGDGTAVNVMVRDYLPANMTFAGMIRKNGAAVPSAIGYRFYDVAGKPLPIVSPETFTDANSNGLYDPGESYVDANGNNKYDDLTGAALSLVRSIEFPAGNVAGGIGGNFTYRAKTTSSPGITITSDAGGMTGVKNGLDYTKVVGYHLTCDNLHFPVNGTPKQVKVLVTGPATFDFPQGLVKSRTEMVGTQITQIAIPFGLTEPNSVAASSLTMSGNKMTITIPKGYLASAGVVVDDAQPTPQSRTGTLTRNASTGITTLTFPINEWKKGTVAFSVQLDPNPLIKSALKAADGHIKAPLTFTPTLSGGYVKAGKPVAIGSITRLLGALPVRDTISPPPQAAARAGAPAPPTPLADAKIFVGRCAPVSVKRGEAFAVTIFVGNLTDLHLSLGTIEMSVPAGCDYIGTAAYAYNAQGAAGEVYRSSSDSGFVSAKSGSKVSWNIGSFLPREGGAVQLTLKVREDFTGTRIDDNSCIFDVVNACGKTPGPIGIVVREGNETTQSSSIVGSAISGAGLVGSTPSLAGLLGPQVFSDTSPFHTTIGGADILQLLNGVTVVPLGGNRVLTIGRGDKIIAAAGQVVVQLPYWTVAVGGDSSSGVRLTKLPTMPANVVQSASTLLARLHNKATSLVSARGGNIFNNGGGNLVAAGAGNLVGNDGSTLTGPNGAKLVGNDGSTFTAIPDILGPDGAQLVGNDGSTMVAAGGLNMVAAGGGNLVAAGAGNLVAAGGGNIAGQISPMVAAGAGNLISQDVGLMVAAGAGNMVAAGAGNLVNAGGLNLIVNPKQ